MTTLYALTEQYRADADKLSDLDLPHEVVSDTLEAMGGELEVKAQNVALMIRSFEADAAAVKQWAKDASARAKAIENRAESLRQYLERCLTDAGIKKVEGPGVVLSFRASTAVDVYEPGLIPAQYMKTPEPPPPAPDKVAIAAALKRGEEVQGVRLESRQNLQIK